MNALRTPRVFKTLKTLLLPDLPREVAREIDKDAVRAILYSSFAFFLVEVASIVAYTVTHTSYDSQAFTSVGSMLTCCALCLAGYYVSRGILSRWPRDHGHVMVFKVLYFVTLSAWGIFESARNYAVGGQMLTFFAVEIMMSSFLAIRPWISAILIGGAYGTLYLALLGIDGAARISIFGYLAITLVSMAGMIVRFHVQRDATQRAIELRYVGTHDGLTGLRNREALNEDVEEFLGKELVVRMSDVNYFKEINDAYGHLTGDLVLGEMGSQLESLYPHDKIYRFGGDEFLIVGEKTSDADLTTDSREFACSTASGETITVALSIGYVTGTPRNPQDLFDLMGQADRALYEVKKRVHANDQRPVRNTK